ncbi:Bacteriohemerythrin [Magnetospirillum sp. LM-5]|uniref:bacteriohemerythrin n=1 Tax=Magnetospirillum sp. LM-5 TaxID=2681466 RepID=UPI00137F2C49|nr:bacteriohemerythrin [Magnetospirillum sp. LM-5]CAA7624697.1 Bacteriohemerythrin [Magnetospirillum sp. LM-5]
MAMLTWDEAYSVGSAILDSDHRIIFSLLAQLNDATDTDQSREVVGSVLKVLAEYAEHHFRREEAIMRRANYPLAEQHEQLHHDLEKKVTQICERWRAGERDALSADVQSLLKNWLTDHILEDDKAYGPWVEAAQEQDGAVGGPANGWTT